VSAARPERSYAGLSDIGRVRVHNEDAVLLSPPLFAVADGLGGHEAGEVASTIAIEALMNVAPARADAKALGRAARTANKAVIDAAKEGVGREGMGTTLTAAVVEGSRIAIAHVGDSRAYLLHDDVLERVTEDHSMVADMIRQGTLTEEESRDHPNRSVITRALGSDPNMHADTFEVTGQPGDKLLLCSDGLTGMLTDQQIAETLGAYRDPETASRALVDAANAAGGQDNVSVVVVEITGDEGEPLPKSRGWIGISIWVFALFALLFGAAWGVNNYARSRAYVIAENDVVVLYRGVSGEVAGVELSWLEVETTITPRALGPVTSARLAQGIPLESVTAGYALLESYRSQIASAEATPAVSPAEGESPTATTTPE
jgi:protein phosphatase